MSLRRERLPDPVSYYEQVGVRLAGSGAKRTAKCPFHEDTRPSFLVNVDDGSFHCFSCDARGGDVIDYHRRMYGLSFVDAVKDLGAWSSEEPKAVTTPRQVRPRVGTPAPNVTLASNWRDTWNGLLPVDDSPVAEYLQARCCEMPRSHVR